MADWFTQNGLDKAAPPDSVTPTPKGGKDWFHQNGLTATQDQPPPTDKKDEGPSIGSRALSNLPRSTVDFLRTMGSAAGGGAQESWPKDSAGSPATLADINPLTGRYSPAPQGEGYLGRLGREIGEFGSGLAAPFMHPQESFAEDPVGTVGLPAAVAYGGLRGAPAATIKGATKGAWEGASAPSSIKVWRTPVELPVPASISGAVGGATAGHIVGGPTGAMIGGGVGAAAPAIKGALEGGRRALSDYRAAQRFGMIGNPAWRDMPDTGSPIAQEQGPQGLPPSVLASGRAPGPAPQPELPPSPIRVAGWQGKTTGAPAPPPADATPIPPQGGVTLTGRRPGPVPQSDLPPQPAVPPGIERVKGLPKEITGDMMAVENPKGIPARYAYRAGGEKAWELDKKMADNLLKSGATPEGVADKLQLPDDSLIEARNMHGSTKTRAKSGSKELDQRRADLVETMKELQGQQSTLPRRIQLP